MPRLILVLTMLCALASSTGMLFAQTDVGGTISSNTTWTLGGSPYNVLSSVTISDGVTLTINPGVTVKFPGTGLYVYGTLNAVGSGTDSVWFTSASGTPSPGDWQGITFYGSTANASVLRRCVVLYGGGGGVGNIYCLYYTGESNPTIENSRIAFSSSYGIYVSASSPVIGGNSIGFDTSATYGYPIYLSGTCSPAFSSPNSFPGNKFTAIRVTGVSSMNTFTWAKAGCPYVVEGNMSINQGTTATLSPGVIVKFASGAGLYVYGELHAAGTVADSIVFTSTLDDSYGGDTNGDGGATTPSPGDWQGITFYGSTANASVLRRCVVLYGGGGGVGNIYCLYYTGESNPTIENSRIAFSSSYGIYVSASSPVIGGNSIGFDTSATYGYPIYLSGTCSPAFSSPNSFPGNKFTAIRVTGVSSMNTFTWAKAGCPYVVEGNMSINQGTTATLSPGVIVKFASGAGLYVYGELHAAGTVADSIVFTSTLDDSYGGDTNGDGGATTPSPGDWQGITFYGSTANASVLRRCVVLYGGGGGVGNIYCLYYTGESNPTIENSRIAFSSSYGIYVSASSPVIGGNSIGFDTSATYGYPIYLSGTCSPAFSSPNSFPGNKFTAIRVTGVSSMNTFTWAKAGCPYVVEGNMSINQGTTATLSPGVIVKFASGAGLYVYGELHAAGTVADSIVFTSTLDDSYGGDTNGDGGATTPSPGDWQGITFYGSTANASVLRRCVVLYGGGGGVGNIYCLYYTGESNPTIENSRIAFSSNAGIYCSGSRPRLVHNALSGNLHYGVQNVTSSPMIDARSNWWGDSTGPYHPSLNPSGMGDTVSDYVLFTPWLHTWPPTDIIVSFTIQQGWNMVSLPVTVEDPRKSIVFPNASSNAFRFVPGQGYVVRDSLETSLGYWLKFPNPDVVKLAGPPILRDTISVVAGWNMIGTIAVPAVVDSIIQIPSGIVSSNFFGFAGGYTSATTLLPGKSYFVKVNQNGQLILR